MPYKTYRPVPEEEMGKDELAPVPQHEPAPEEEMDRTRWEGHHSVCQTIREIYRMTDNEEIKMKCRLAMSMTKAMHERLKKYKLGGV